MPPPPGPVAHLHGLDHGRTIHVIQQDDVNSIHLEHFAELVDYIDFDFDQPPRKALILPVHPRTTLINTPKSDTTGWQAPVAIALAVIFFALAFPMLVRSRTRSVADH